MTDRTMITSTIDLALERLNHGDIIGMPTETVYGLAADASCDKAIRKIFAMKNRPINHPLILHVAQDWDLNQWAENIPDYVFELTAQFWPGPLTLVLSTKPGSVNPLVNGGQDSVAIRCPNHPVAQELLRRFGKPVVAPSANLFGKISPTTSAHVFSSFKNQDLLILEGGRCAVGIESTIVMATDPRGYQILRHGVIDAVSIEAAVGLPVTNEDNNTRVPGKLDTHYQPEKPLYYVNDLSELQKIHHRTQTPICLLTISPYHARFQELHYPLPSDPALVAHELYYQLRRADDSEAEVIVIELPPNTDPWQGVRERILKAGRPL